MITRWYLSDTFSGITSVGCQHIQYTHYIQRMPGTIILQRDRDILSLQSTKDLVQDKAEL